MRMPARKEWNGSEEQAAEQDLQVRWEFEAIRGDV